MTGTKTEQWLTVTGNPLEGIIIWGPFDTQEEAHNYGCDQDEDFWITPLKVPGGAR
jgi:hypothetical protein